jgi:uncharacterized protein YbgA (DUF1722 family)/uncharacterized protein YbbK (DUF523 family)
LVEQPFAIPVVVVRRYLAFDHCRYNGETIPDALAERMKPHVRYRTVWPAAEIELGAGRRPSRVVAAGCQPRLIQSDTGVGITSRTTEYVEGFFRSLGPVDGFVLKNRSPSCGINDVRAYSEDGKGAGKWRGSGFFGGAVTQRFSHLAVENEGRLRNHRIRHHFPTRWLTLAAFRQVRESGQAKDLLQPQARNKLLLMAYSQTELRVLGRLAAHQERRPLSELVLDYEHHLQSALSRPARCTSRINVMQHGLGHFSKQPARAEKRHFVQTLERYRESKVPSSTLTGLAAGRVVRFQQPYLMEQKMFQPCLDNLVDGTDSGKEQACSGE